MIDTHKIILFFNTDIPGAPQNVQATNVTSTTVSLTWSPPRISETIQLIIYSYNINCSTDLNFIMGNTVKDTDSLSATLSYLLPFTSYNCCLAVNSAHGKGKLSCLKVVTCELHNNIITLSLLTAFQSIK